MSEQLQTPLEIETGQDKNIRTQLFRVNAQINIVGVIIALLSLIINGLVNHQFLIWPMILIAGGYTLVALFVYWLNAQGHWYWTITIHLISLTAFLFALAYYTNGSMSPFVIVLITVPLSAQLFGERRLSRWALWSIVILYLGMSTMEALGILQPMKMPTLFLRIMYVILLFATLEATVIVTSIFKEQSRQSLSIAQQQNQELAKASQQAEETALAERASKQQQEKNIRYLQQTVQKYKRFLGQVITGNYNVRLALEDKGDIDNEIYTDLHTLGEYLNTSVEALTGALNNLQAVQRRYVRGAWESYTPIGKQRNFRYSKEKGSAIPDDNITLPFSSNIPKDVNAIADSGELTLPIKLHGEVIGAIAARRETKSKWSDEDIALSTAINDQLAQTIENLRLLEETQRRAERDRLTSRIMTHMRETLDVDTILQTAVREMRENMDLHDVTIKLGSPQQQSTSYRPSVEESGSPSGISETLED
ncbi:MAG: hypothetical protein DRI56_01215 [Chloroflexota bacterium]|nr:MAG: hypothetical protein DRI56_01215 [Chloroflexota bacterium]